MHNLKSLLVFTIIFLFGFNTFGQKADKLIAESVKNATQQYKIFIDSIASNEKAVVPRNFKEGKIGYTGLNDWTSGFFPASLWYLYELSGDKFWLENAKKYTERMEKIKYFKGNHDIGFMMNCSFGNALRLTQDTAYNDILITSAETLILRFRKNAGIIQSWDASSKWGCPVIIDNMMNLELLFNATEISGNQKYRDIAISHANKTLENHFRADNSSYHVVDYDTLTGKVLQKRTHQGYSDSSAWARGQAWGLYGFTMCYRFTKDEKYLLQAEKIADYIFNNPNLPKDLIPYWDYNIPNIQNEPRDVSAAAITASALYELSTYSKKGKRYSKYADKIIKSLSSSTYTAKYNQNAGFILKHSTGAKPFNSEVDVPLIYADYYYLEALKRKRDLMFIYW